MKSSKNYLEFWQIDAFTDHIFGGNSAAVCVVESFPKEKLMQDIAMEMNLSETVFVKNISADRFHIRWFTPTVEVKMCGHATLATAHVLFRIKKLPFKTIIFESLSGPLTATHRKNLIELNFPIQETKTAAIPKYVSQCFDKKPLAAALAGGKDGYLILEYKNQQEIKNLTPDFGKIKKATNKAIIVTARHNDDYVLRFFAPSHGIDEDPVTGSACTVLTDYWHKKLNKDNFTVTQLSKREGVLFIEKQGDRILISGKSVEAASGKLRVA